MNKILKWLTKLDHKRALNQLERRIEADASASALAMLEYAVQWLPMVNPCSPRTSVSIPLAGRASSVDELIYYLRRVRVAIELDQDFTELGYADLPFSERTLALYLTDMDGYSLSESSVLTVLIPAVEKLTHYLGMAVSSGSDYSSYYQRHTQPLAHECYQLTRLLLAQSDPLTYPLS